MHPLFRYITTLPTGKTVLWCYLIWYLVIAGMYFDPAPSIWLNAAGISAIIGTALWLGIRGPGSARVGFWPMFRLYLTPFCVSSFSSLIKGRGFILVFPPDMAILRTAAVSCAAFVLSVAAAKVLVRERLA